MFNLQITYKYSWVHQSLGPRTKNRVKGVLNQSVLLTLHTNCNRKVFFYIFATDNDSNENLSK